ncbi:signal peptidase I [Clostridium sp. D2Q-11]|uniref:Signal peptidase I n=1 Tax=Anaeromonas frigoriresistens TaxID=2683708 RepID=A0A942Z5U3_9FIRM|nr:signal peptidase I [Anaeromonas frigoriresistens]MBS4537801.1 signal peptidase I [Anaeromonas frigoriresistens]
MSRSSEFNIGDLIKTILIALVISILIEKYLISLTVVSGDSMMSTLHNNDRLVIEKMSYRFDSPERGEIIIFEPPIYGRENEIFVKRVVAISGDKYKVEENKVYINGELLKEEYAYNNDGSNLPYPFTEGIVPKESVFVLGDNRNNSNDSRMFGYVTLDRIKGKVFTKIWPIKSHSIIKASYNLENDINK